MPQEQKCFFSQLLLKIVAKAPDLIRYLHRNSSFISAALTVTKNISLLCTVSNLLYMLS